MAYWPIAIVTLLNLWIWRLLTENLIIALVTLATTISLYLSMQRTSKMFFSLFALLVYFQWSGTPPFSLTLLDNDEQRVQQERLNLYPPTYIKLGEKTLWLPLAHWMEGRKETVAFYRLEENFFQAIDPSLYFFVNHPRERIGVNEFEKFPYALLPIFLVGVVWSFTKRSWALGFSFVVPVVLLTIIGNNHPLSNFSLFPAIAASIALGLKLYVDHLKNLKYGGILLKASFIIFVLVFIQTIIYQTSG